MKDDETKAQQDFATGNVFQSRSKNPWVGAKKKPPQKPLPAYPFLPGFVPRRKHGESDEHS